MAIGVVLAVTVAANALLFATSYPTFRSVAFMSGLGLLGGATTVGAFAPRTWLEGPSLEWLRDLFGLESTTAIRAISIAFMLVLAGGMAALATASR
jgi:hypothetical protein